MIKSRVLTIQQILESENKFISKFSQKKILEFAGNAIAKYLEKNFKKQRIVFICGSGNNGNDGILASKFLNKKKIKNYTYEIKKEKKDEKQKKLKLLIEKSDLLVDCIFGTGLNRKISGIEKKIIDILNDSKKKIISIDIPSGINGDSGEKHSSAIGASLTIAMGFYKPAYFLLPSKKYCGKVVLLDLTLKVPKKCLPEINLINENFFKNKIPKFEIDINKYHKGHVLVIGGEMSGASRIVALAARKIGAGLSTLSVPEKYLKFYSGVEPGTILSEFNFDIFKNKSVLVIGPGLGKSFDRNLLIKILEVFNGPIVIDADAISIFKNKREFFYNCIKKKRNIVLTPHSGEFRRIFDYNLNNKINASINASKKINNTIILKGNDTVLAFPQNQVWLSNNSKNTLATAGTGDALCGIIAGLLAQNMEFKPAIVGSLWIQGQLSLSKKNVTVEDFLKFIPDVLLKLRK
ncbi:MAG: hypothetical protein CMM95_01295 [Rickettsiales bacterium]|nr:hypothetical protein [Rickettsiales bacterium]